MVEQPRPASSTAREAPRRELALRIASAIVLAPLAVGVAWLGGWAFFAFWTLAAWGILHEWRKIVAEYEPLAVK